MTPSQQALIDTFKAEQKAAIEECVSLGGKLSFDKKRIHSRVKFEAAFRMGYEPAVYDMELEAYRLYQEGDTLCYTVRCPHCGRIYKFRQGHWMEKHMAEKHGDEHAWRKRFDIPLVQR